MRQFLLGLFAAASLAVALTVDCAQNNLDALASQSSCGCSKKLTECLRAKTDSEGFDQVQACFTASGCAEEEASISAKWFIRECEKVAVQDELRKRQGSSTSNDEEDDSATSAQEENTSATQKQTEEEKTTEQRETATAAAKTTEAEEATSVPATTDAATTADTTSAATAATTTDTPQSTTSSDATTTQVTALSQTGTTTSLECSVTKLVTTTACSYSAGKKVTCTPTVTPSATCAPGVICMDDTLGAGICMRRDNHLTTSGLAVTIIFAVGIVGVLIAIIVALRQSSNAEKRAKAERAALLGSSKGFGNGDVENMQSYGGRATANTSEAHIPLIPTGEANGQGQYGHHPSSRTLGQD